MSDILADLRDPNFMDKTCLAPRAAEEIERLTRERDEAREGEAYYYRLWNEAWPHREYAVNAAEALRDIAGTARAALDLRGVDAPMLYKLEAILSIAERHQMGRSVDNQPSGDVAKAVSANAGGDMEAAVFGRSTPNSASAVGPKDAGPARCHASLCWCNEFQFGPITRDHHSAACDAAWARRAERHAVGVTAEQSPVQFHCFKCGGPGNHFESDVTGTYPFCASHTLRDSLTVTRNEP